MVDVDGIDQSNVLAFWSCDGLGLIDWRDQQKNPSKMRYQIMATIARINQSTLSTKLKIPE